jgi:hypothetical protein
MAAECPTCLGVSRGGRIRVTELSAANMQLGLQAQRQRWLMLRRMAIEAGLPESTRVAEEHLKAIGLAVEELKRTSVEMGWQTSAT